MWFTKRDQVREQGKAIVATMQERTSEFKAKLNAKREERKPAGVNTFKQVTAAKISFEHPTGDFVKKFDHEFKCTEGMPNRFHMGLSFYMDFEHYEAGNPEPKIDSFYCEDGRMQQVVEGGLEDFGTYELETLTNTAKVTIPVQKYELAKLITVDVECNMPVFTAPNGKQFVSSGWCGLMTIHAPSGDQKFMVYNALPEIIAGNRRKYNQNIKNWNGEKAPEFMLGAEAFLFHLDKVELIPGGDSLYRVMCVDCPELEEKAQEQNNTTVHVTGGAFDDSDLPF